MWNKNEEVQRLKSEKFTVNTAKSVKKLLDGVLKVEANSASCLIIYEPKTPAELKKFKKVRWNAEYFIMAFEKRCNNKRRYRII